MIHDNYVRASSMFATLLGLAGLLQGASEPFLIPDWLTPFPEGVNQHMTNSTVSAEASYTAPAPPAQVVEHYEQALHKAGITFQTKFDGLGTTVVASAGKTSCVVRASESESGTAVSVSCARQLEKNEPGGVLPLLEPVEAPSPAPVPNQVGGPATGPCAVEYAVDGGARAATVTYRNREGGTDQKVVNFPYKTTFIASPGSELYLSAKKVRLHPEAEHAPVDVEDLRTIARRRSFVDGISGDAHVAVRVNGKLLEEATTSAPYGVATAKGSCPK